MPYSLSHFKICYRKLKFLILSDLSCTLIWVCQLEIQSWINSVSHIHTYIPTTYKLFKDINSCVILRNIHKPRSMHRMKCSYRICIIEFSITLFKESSPTFILQSIWIFALQCFQDVVHELPIDVLVIFI